MKSLKIDNNTVVPRYSISKSGFILDNDTGLLVTVYYSRGFLESPIQLNGKRRLVNLGRAVYLTYNDDIPDGFALIYVDDNPFNLHLDNIMIVKSKMLNQMKK